MALVVAGAVAQADGHGRAAGGRRGDEVGMLVPIEAEGVDDVEAELGRALHREARHFCGGGVAVTKPEAVRRRN